MSVKQFRISIFPPKTPIASVIGSNGIILDSICTSCTTEEECSTIGDYTLDAEFVNGNDLANNIYEDCILKVLEDYGYEIFRIVKYNPRLKRTTIMAKQITIEEQKSLWLDDVRPTGSNGQAALNYMLTNSIGAKEITLESNIDITNTAYYERMNFYKACFDCEQSFINRWGSDGLEVTRRGNKITFNKSRGLKKNLTVKERKNLTGFSGNANIDSYVTRGIGKGFDGILGHYIESPKKDIYSRVKTKVFEYSDVKVKTSDMGQDEEGMIFDTLAEAQTELDRRVQTEFSTNHVDDIVANYNIDFVQLQNTEEYKEYSYLESADCGDYVKVQIPSIGINITVRVMKKTYDILRQRTTDMKLSNMPIQASISTATIINNLKKEYIKTGDNDINRYITAIINSGLQNSHVIVRPNEILIMDTKDINTSKNIWRWNGKALAHSSDGYYSNNWNIGITQDGVINASMILTGVLSAVTIKNTDGSFILDLSGTNGVKFYNYNELAMSISNNNIDFYNFKKSNQYIGSVGCTVRTKNDGTWLPDKPVVDMWHEKNSMLDIGYKGNDGTNNVYPYIRFDEYNINNVDNIPMPIKICKNVGLVDGAKIDMMGNNSIFGEIALNGKNDLSIMSSENKNVKIGWMNNNRTDYTNMVEINKQGFKAYGDKQCVQRTEYYGDVGFSATEDISALLTLTLWSVNITEEDKGEDGYYYKRIDIPNIIKATINVKDYPYTVYINKIHTHKDCSLWEKTPEYFIVTSDEPCKFDFKIEGRRKGFEYRCIEEMQEKGKNYRKEQQEIAGDSWKDYGRCYEG